MNQVARPDFARLSGRRVLGSEVFIPADHFDNSVLWPAFPELVDNRGHEVYVDRSPLQRQRCIMSKIKKFFKDLWEIKWILFGILFVVGLIVFAAAQEILKVLAYLKIISL